MLERPEDQDPNCRLPSAVCRLPAVLRAEGAAYAARSTDDAMNKGSEGADVLSSKLARNADAASKMMSEMREITGNGTVTEQTRSKLDALLVRAKKL